MNFPTTFDKWRADIDTRLWWYTGITLAELPRVHGALRTWYDSGRFSAFTVAQCLAACIPPCGSMGAEG